MPPTTAAEVLTLVQTLIGFLNSNVDAGTLAKVVLDSQSNGVSLGAALTAVDLHVATIVTNPVFEPVAKLFLDRLSAVYAAK